MEIKKCIYLIIACLLSVNLFAQNATEKISLTFKNISLKEAMKKIEQASDYVFSYDVTDIDVSQKVSLSADNEEIRLALYRMFTPTDLNFQIQKNRLSFPLKSFKM